MFFFYTYINCHEIFFVTIRLLFIYQIKCEWIWKHLLFEWIFLKHKKMKHKKIPFCHCKNELLFILFKNLKRIFYISTISKHIYVVLTQYPFLIYYLIVDNNNFPPKKWKVKQNDDDKWWIYYFFFFSNIFILIIAN